LSSIPRSLHHTPYTPDRHSFPTRRSSDLAMRSHTCMNSIRLRSLLSFAELVDKQCGAGFSLRGTSVPLQRPAGTCDRRAEAPPRSEEHTSELQSRVDLVCRLLLEKKK